MKPQQLLQDLISGQITPEEFKRRAFQPSGAQASPEVMKAAFRVPVTSEGRHLDTGEPMSEWLPRLKKQYGRLRVVDMGVTWEEWQAFLSDGDGEYFEELQAEAARQGVTVDEVRRQLDRMELKNSTLY